jgi:hypothetical protein
MPSRREKIVAHAEHLLDVFRALRGRFALLEPLLFDEAIVRRLGSGRRRHGMHLLTSALLNSCALEIAKIFHDGDGRSASLTGLVESLGDEMLLTELRERYAVWNIAPTSGNDSDILALIQAGERREEEQRRLQFAELVATLRTRYGNLQSSFAMASFRAMRDQLLAHNQMSFDGTTYHPLDVTALGLKFGDMRVAIDEIEAVMNLVTLIFRNSSFDFARLREQLTADRDAFWSQSS